MVCTILASHEGSYGINATIELLRAGKHPLDALEAGIQMVENDSRARTVGFGGAPNILGIMECDASIMDGTSLRSGAVGAIQHCKNPITAARRVMDTLPHVLLVGEGATRFARELGLEQSNLLYSESLDAYKNWLAHNIPNVAPQSLPSSPLIPHISFQTRSDLSKGTVTFLVRDAEGNLYGGVSTSGWSYKYPGRLGDSPVIGAGMYVNSRYGGAACTHTGEMTIRASTARAVVLYMKKGASVEAACLEAVSDLCDLKGGYQGPVIIHAIDRHGTPFVITTGGDDGDLFHFWQEPMDSFQSLKPNKQ